MLERRSAFGFVVHTPCGPRKSGMPDSVEMPAPVSATTRAEASTQADTTSILSLTAGRRSSLFLPAPRRWRRGRVRRAFAASADRFAVLVFLDLNGLHRSVSLNLADQF